MPPGFATAFAATDARARAVVYWQQCAATVLRLRAAGTFGAVARAPNTVHCERTEDGVPVGGVFDIDTGYTRARRLTLVRLDGARPRYTGAIDTARVAQGARLARDATRNLLLDLTEAARRRPQPFTVIAVSPAEGPTEAWAIPRSLQGGRTAIQGGDIAMVRAPNGTLRRIVDHRATWKLITIPATGAVRIVSSERETATVSDLAIARSLAEAGRNVTVVTTLASSMLLPGADVSGSRFHWEHSPVAPAPGTKPK